jgi:hypothetical protein
MRTHEKYCINDQAGPELLDDLDYYEIENQVANKSRGRHSSTIFDLCRQ